MPRESFCSGGGDISMMGDASSDSEPNIPWRESLVRDVLRVGDRGFGLLVSRSCSLPLRDLPVWLRLEALVFE